MKEGHEEAACMRVFEGHEKGVYPLIYVPAKADMAEFDLDEDVVHFGDILITGSADGTAKSWSIESGRCIKVEKKEFRSTLKSGRIVERI